MAEQNNTQQQQEHKPKKIPLTTDMLAAILENNGITVRINAITWKPSVTIDPSKNTLIKGIDVNDFLPANLPSILSNALMCNYSYSATAQVSATLQVIAAREIENPVLDFISHVKWDGNDRLEQVYSMLGISEKDTLSRTLIHLWLKQGIALLHNNRKFSEEPFGGESILVLVGKQGFGKTRFFRKLAMREEWFREGQRLDRFDKDHQRRAITTWIAEFGELESVIHDADCNSLKNFVTAGVDNYRPPYAMQDCEKRRCTLLAGTANSDKFLADPTGNRRFWVIPITKKRITDEEFDALDAAQLWAQIYDEVHLLSPAKMAACFRITTDDKTFEQLSARNMKHNASRPYEDELRDIFTIIGQAPDAYEYVWCTISQWKEAFPSLKNAYVGTLGSRINEFIDAHEYKIKSKRSGKHGRLYYLPLLKADENARFCGR